MTDEASLPEEMPPQWTDLLAGTGDRLIRAAPIVRIEEGAAWFDTGSKHASSIPLTDWDGETPPRVGDRYPVLIEEVEDVADRPLKIVRMQVRTEPKLPLEEMLAAFSVGQQYTGRISRRISDGFLVDIGVNAFLPDRDAPAEMLADPAAYLDTEIYCRVTEINFERPMIRVAISDIYPSQPS